MIRQHEMQTATKMKKTDAKKRWYHDFQLQSCESSSSSGISVSPAHMLSAKPIIRVACTERLSICVCSTPSCSMSTCIRLTIFSCITDAALTLAHITRAPTTSGLAAPSKWERAAREDY